MYLNRNKTLATRATLCPERTGADLIGSGQTGSARPSIPLIRVLNFGIKIKCYSPFTIFYLYSAYKCPTCLLI